MQFNQQNTFPGTTTSNQRQSDELLQLIFNQSNPIIKAAPPSITIQNPSFPQFNIYPNNMFTTNLLNNGTLLFGLPPPQQPHIPLPLCVNNININNNNNNHNINNRDIRNDIRNNHNKLSIFNTLFPTTNTVNMNIVKPENLKFRTDYPPKLKLDDSKSQIAMPLPIENKNNVNKFETTNNQKIVQSQNSQNNNEENKKSYSCDVCSKVFKHRSNLKIHYVVHTPDALSCNFCEKKFARKSNLNQHLRVHTGEKPYQCAFCSKKFAQSHSLKDHVRIHTGERPFQCDFCGKKFKVKHNMIAHRRLHTGEKPFQCPFCVKGFASKSSLNGHQKKKHPLNASDIQIQ